MRSAAVLMLVLAGCAPELRPCASPACGARRECLANRCVPTGGEPVPKNTERVVVVANRVAARAAAGPIPFVTFGRGRGSDDALYLGFDGGWKQRANVVAAFLLFDTLGGASSGAPFSVEVWKVAAPWSPEGVARGERPALRLPRARGLGVRGEAATTRVDVTRVVQSLARAKVDAGLAVVARDPDPNASLTVATGTASGVVATGTASDAPPRLEIYLRRHD